MLRRAIVTLALVVGCGGGGGDPIGADAGGLDAGEEQRDAAVEGACGPAGGTYWVVEGEALSVEVGCRTDLVLPGTEFAITPLPAGARYDAATARLEWTPGLDQAAVYDLTVTVPSLDESGSLRIGVIDRWDDDANVLVLDPRTYTEEYGLPVLHLRTDPAINHDDYTPATVTYRGHLYQVEAKYRGGASFGYPKLSYTIKFARDDRFHEDDRGFVDRRKIVLTTTFDDNSYLRQRLAFEMWNRLDPAHLQIDSFSVVVFLDGEYRGLYALTDHVDRFLTEAHGLSPDGNLYKAINHDANFMLTSLQNDGAPKVTLHDGYEKKEGLPLEGEPGAFDDLEALVTFVATSSDADFRDEIGDWIDRRDYEDWWIFVSFIQAGDSAGKNSYHYHDPIGGGPWRYAPWDFNASFGQTWQSERERPDAEPEVYAWTNELFARFFAEPTIMTPLRARYGDTLDGAYSVAALTALLDEMAGEIHDSAVRDEGRWRDEMRSYPGWSWRDDFTTHEEEIEYLRDWLADRWSFVSARYRR